MLSSASWRIVLIGHNLHLSEPTQKISLARRVRFASYH
jgi:hypothetical protein